jgi:hypothetical protein
MRRSLDFYLSILSTCAIDTSAYGVHIGCRIAASTCRGTDSQEILLHVEEWVRDTSVGRTQQNLSA